MWTSTSSMVQLSPLTRRTFTALCQQKWQHFGLHSYLCSMITHPYHKKNLIDHLMWCRRCLLVVANGLRQIGGTNQLAMMDKKQTTRNNIQYLCLYDWTGTCDRSVFWSEGIIIMYHHAFGGEMTQAIVDGYHLDVVGTTQ